ncbi:MAG TPA: post-COAP-1 domain-containing protein [Roseimicrobium sp.]|nr:post-COAP-1 domain-containing protein [Roseimicrobium sp.]
MKMKTLITLIAGTLLILLCCGGTLASSASAQVPYDYAAGGGWIAGTPSGGRANFGVAAGVVTNATTGNTFLFGSLNYADRSAAVHVRSTGVSAYTVVDERTRQVVFDVLVGRIPGTATVVVSDLGEPGRWDTFSITLSNGYIAEGLLGGGNRGGGNIQVKPSLPPPTE